MLMSCQTCDEVVSGNLVLVISRTTDAADNATALLHHCQVQTVLRQNLALQNVAHTGHSNTECQEKSNQHHQPDHVTRHQHHTTARLLVCDTISLPRGSLHPHLTPKPRNVGFGCYSVTSFYPFNVHLGAPYGRENM
jgi:hypothetical protein